jgi:hypothetical protein
VLSAGGSAGSPFSSTSAKRKSAMASFPTAGSRLERLQPPRGEVGVTREKAPGSRCLLVERRAQEPKVPAC